MTKTHVCTLSLFLSWTRIHLPFTQSKMTEQLLRRFLHKNFTIKAQICCSAS